MISSSAIGAGIQSEIVSVVRVQMYTNSTAYIRVGSRWFKLDLSKQG